MRVQDQKVANEGYTYMAPFWRQNQLVGTKKIELKGELQIWRTKVQARV
jgi:hypothetical protein